MRPEVSSEREHFLRSLPVSLFRLDHHCPCKVHRTAYPASLLSLLQGSTIALVNSIKNISFYFCSTSVGDASFPIRAELISLYPHQV